MPKAATLTGGCYFVPVSYNEYIERGVMRHVVIGMGEVGSAVSAVLAEKYEVYTRDKEGLDLDINVDFMHVCYPWSEDFVSDTMRYRSEYNAAIVIVHSTVPIGTCRNNDWIHSPIRGKHPELEEGVVQFVKHFGGRGAAIAASMWEAIPDCSAIVHDNASDTEAGKLWELVQYGVQIRMEKAIYAYCEENNLDHSIVYEAFAYTYNYGFTALDEDHFVRPILKHMPGEIGGHCVLPMSELLDHPAADIVRQGFK